MSGQTAADVFGRRRSTGERPLDRASHQTAERRSRKRKERESEGNGTLQGSIQQLRFCSNMNVEAPTGFRRAGFLYLGAARVRAPKVPASLGRARNDTSLACVLTRSGNASDLAFEWTLHGEQSRAARRIRPRTRSGAMQTKLHSCSQVPGYGAELRLDRTWWC
ncbi:hypothetical protein M440DRAFT_1191700 [Trichoderma longibrachiatum ATCC 18648]|uniref:Uncharacterized protein n=1 Tax=Trichoderma longibrachiatum ATCC 18648 TaxID=983965 RepID=A0A2T4CA27_TRILO|nr:hypothetical protein M440DRAFT_1191700 [Trichoderma longibrachiatum ATCC 18648]